jgi:hypothetical protein
VAGTDAVFYVGTDQNLYELLFSSGAWSPIGLAKANAPLVGNGSFLSAHLNTAAVSEEVFFVTASGTVEEMWSGSTAVPAWHATNLIPGSAASAIPPNPQSPLATDMDSVTGASNDELYYVGTDAGVHGLSWSAKSGVWTIIQP